MRLGIYAIIIGMTAALGASYGSLWAQGGGNHEPDDGKGTGGAGSPVHIVAGYCNICGDGHLANGGSTASGSGIPGIY